MKNEKQLLAAQALLPEGWRDNVLLEWDGDGVLTKVQPGHSTQYDGERAELVIPGMVNLHSHAFQRAMAGLTEYRANPVDSFWSWRTLMYRFAARLSPEILKAVARQLYGEMLMAGYTSVCEFHYLHHDADGKPYACAGEMSACLIEAAADAGIGLTLLPVMYQYSGFGAKAPLENQARFINSPQWMLQLLQDMQSAHPQHAGLRGLEIMTPEGTWREIPPVDGAFVINIGDLMARWTNDRWVSTLHRVVNVSPEQGGLKRRQSIAFFHQPDWHAEISTLPSCVAAGEAGKYEHVLSGPYLMGKFKKTVM